MKIKNTISLIKKSFAVKKISRRHSKTNAPLFVILIFAVILISSLLAALPAFSAAAAAASQNLSTSEEVCAEQFEIFFFYSETCSHCRAESAYLKKIEEKYPELKVNYYLASENKDLLMQFADKYNSSTAGVPRTFIGDKQFVGFTSESGDLEFNSVLGAYTGYENQLTNEILKNLNNTTHNANESSREKMPTYLVFLLIIIYLLSYPLLKKKLSEKEKYMHIWKAGLITIIVASVFIFVAATPEVLIKDFAEKMPFPLFVFIVAIADSFNPCAFTVFVILLSLLTYTKNRRDMLIVGSVFIFASAIMYFIFIMAMIFVGSWALEEYGQIIMKILGIAIIIAGVINTKDYFFYKKGISLSIDDKHKSNIMKKAGNIVTRLKDRTSKKAFILAILATFVLAVFVNIIELGCTAILPAVYMASLVGNYGNAIGFMHIAWTAAYSVIYVVPLFAILGIFIYTFKSARFTESQGRILKLVSGVIMLIFGIIMILRPELLSFS